MPGASSLTLACTDHAYARTRMMQEPRYNLDVISARLQQREPHVLCSEWRVSQGQKSAKKEVDVFRTATARRREAVTCICSFQYCANPRQAGLGFSGARAEVHSSKVYEAVVRRRRSVMFATHLSRAYKRNRTIMFSGAEVYREFYCKAR
jgi:hypothetical protein